MSTSAPDLAAQHDIAARLERLPMSRWHVSIRLIIGVVTFFEAFDQLLIAFSLPEISREWGLSAAGATTTLTVGSVGMLLGALASGWLADRIGRVRVITLCVVITALGNLGMALSPALLPFLVLRFVQGLAIGGEVPTAASYIAEISRAKKRGRFVLMYEVVFPAGLTVGALASAWIVPNWGWRALFLVAAVPGVAAFFLQRKVPESPRWLVARGQHARAREVVDRIERAVRASTGKDLPAPSRVVAAEDAGSSGTSVLRDLFTGRYRRRTLVVWMVWFVGYLANYGLTSWLPTLYQQVFQLSISTALWCSTLASVAGLVGCVLAALTIDRFGRRAVLSVGLGGTAVAMGVLAVLGVTSAGQLAVFSAFAAMFSFAANISLYLYTPELYPTRSRALGCSLGGVFNRLGIITGPILVALVYAGGTGLSTVFALIGGITLVATVITAVFAEETKGRTLEELSP
ncbi:MFS transporter [Saccharopolyspora rhizosphaerae]|uniref:MFS transporter n=1 Tax=Saccharopolyspora rhizosphaerae TaxID=2492662 RepID=A0A3R8Q751_9PSEU|nr:MFS transporter [Saccharopolyspora rhizosphaerae]RRO19934.1 MFS transporter [Saccharopolyspora rhizosphaerae]